ncbi:MAG: CHASE2 domain-containing protein [Oscillatoria sp. SIO1A7]|nr:CHASE2 domain-containing protein [Oscillatoria sp. SIO1A7]
MGKLVVLKIISGDWERGFPVALQIGEEDRLPTTEEFGNLPGCSKLVEDCEQWQYSYKHLPVLLRLDIPECQETNISNREKCRQAAEVLCNTLNSWLDSESFRPLKERLLKKLPESEPIRFVIQTENPQLQQLPWHLWKFFEDYSQAEVALSAPHLEAIEKISTAKNKVRILAILGDSEKINISKDREFLENLPDADVCFLPEPTREKVNDCLWSEQWDVLFFAGHSRTEGETGRISINKEDSLTIGELKNGLKKAIERGLQLAIFNSCDGLGLARDLADLHIPQTIVMREPVPDEVAQKFLINFLKEYAENSRPLNLALRHARERLQGLEKDYPCASWLPVICQNPAEIPPTWQQLRDGVGQDGIAPQREKKSILRYFTYPMLAAGVVALSIFGIRKAGILQPVELKAFDRLMENRPLEAPDDRFLIIAITDEDLRYQNEMGMERQGSLADAALEKILKKLKPHKPRAIGLEVYRDFPVIPKSSDRADLEVQLQETPNFFGICKGGDSAASKGISPPSEVPPERIGFTDIVLDNDGVLRRHLWRATFETNSACQSKWSLSLLLALEYLRSQGIESKKTPESNLELGKATLKYLEQPTGGYQKLDDWGYQMLLNYRNTKRGQLPKSVTLKDFINNRVNPDWVEDKIVLIGVTALSFKDYFATPYSRNRQLSEKIPGVFLQAEMTSQIISAALGDRPLLGFWPQWGEFLWIFGWSLAGGLLAWQLRSCWIFVARTAVAIVILYGTCLFFLIQGTWIPLVPSALALVFTEITIVLTPKIAGDSKE